jgi:hypothetical protein
MKAGHKQRLLMNRASRLAFALMHHAVIAKRHAQRTEAKGVATFGI